MAEYLAILVHGKRGGEGRYEFTGPDDLLGETPYNVMRAFIDSAEATHSIGHIDYEPASRRLLASYCRGSGRRPRPVLRLGSPNLNSSFHEA